MDDRGYVVLHGFLETEVVDEVRRELASMVDEIAKGLVAMDFAADPLEDEPFETRLAQLFKGCEQLAPMMLRHNLQREGFYPLFFHTKFLDVVELFLGPEIRLYPNYTIRPKFPDSARTQVLWHQDAAYTVNRAKRTGDTIGPTEQLCMVNVWTSFVPARVENGCMQFIPGTHKLGVVPYESREHYLEIADRELKPRLDQAVDIETDPGDVVLFSNLLFHQGMANRSDVIRWSADWRYQDATQPTMRSEQGHLARSALQPDEVVTSARQWAQRRFT